MTAQTQADREWVERAIATLVAEQACSADTHLVEVQLAHAPGISLYLKDESSHPTGSLKHRLARSLFLYALCNGWIGPRTVVVEASSGSTAVSQAYFGRLLGLGFIAVVPAATAREKMAQIEHLGARCHRVEDPRVVYAEAERLAAACGGHFMDQFTYAERATDWRGTNNIAESICEQTRRETLPVPRWIVCGAGTGALPTIWQAVRHHAAGCSDLEEKHDPRRGHRTCASPAKEVSDKRGYDGQHPDVRPTGVANEFPDN